MLAYYGDRISPHMTTTPEGFLICHDVPIARTGEMDYRASELALDGGPDRLVKVYRHQEDVFDPAAVASFEGKEVTSGHPTEDVGPENHAAYSKGHVQNVRRRGDYLIADLHLKDAALISDVRSGVLREVSCGYHCRYVPEGDGYRQQDIRGNHVAVVPRGRAGREVAIHDSAEHAGKGKNTMSKFAEAILNAFGMAAKDAKDDQELKAMVTTTMTALDAEPAEKAPEAEPAAKEEKPKEETPAKDAAPLSGLEAKLDKLIELMTARDKAPEKPEGEKALDQMIASLDGGSAATISAGGSADACVTGPARDAALAMLKTMRPVVASIEDAATRTKVTDALLGAIKSPDVLGGIMQAAQQNAQKASDAAAPASFDKLCADQKAAYDARNPHKQKEVN